MYGTGLKLSSDIVTLVTAVNDAGDEATFDKTKKAAMAGIEDALADATLDPTMRQAYEFLDYALEMGKYMEPPTTDSGASLNEVVGSLMALVGQCAFVVAEFMKVVIDAAKEYLKNANTDRIFGLAEQLTAMKASYDQSVASAQSQHDATTMQAITTMVEGAVTAVISVVSVAYAGKSAFLSQEEATGQKVLATMEVDLRQKRVKYENAKAILKATPGDAGAKRIHREAKAEFEAVQKLVDTQKENVAGLQAFASALSSLSGAITSLAKGATMVSAGGNLGASDQTLDSKLEEAEAQYAKSNEGVASTVKQSGDDAVRAALELINSVLELFKSAIPLVVKGPAGNA